MCPHKNEDPMTTDGPQPDLRPELRTLVEAALAAREAAELAFDRAVVMKNGDPLAAAKLATDAAALLAKVAAAVPRSAAEDWHHPEWLVHVEAIAGIRRMRRLAWRSAVEEQQLEPDYYKVLAVMLKAMRLEAGLTQKAIADRLHLSRPAVTSFEQEDRRPSIDKIVEWANACGYDLVLDFRPSDTTRVRDGIPYDNEAEQQSLAVAAERLDTEEARSLVGIARVYPYLPRAIKEFLEVHAEIWNRTYHPDPQPFVRDDLD